MLALCRDTQTYERPVRWLRRCGRAHPRSPRRRSCQGHGVRATGSGPGRLLRGGRRCVGGWGAGAGREAVKSPAEHIMECAEAVRLYIGCAPLFGDGGIAGPEVMVGFAARSPGEPQAVRPVMEALPAVGRRDRAGSVRIRVATGSPTHTNRSAHVGGPSLPSWSVLDHGPVVPCVPQPVALSRDLDDADPVQRKLAAVRHPELHEGTRPGLQAGSGRPLETGEVRVAQRLHAERRRPQARAPEEMRPLAN